MPDDPPLNPGDEAAPGTVGAAEDICRICNGTGRLGDETCGNCGGLGRIMEGIGGG